MLLLYTLPMTTANNGGVSVAYSQAPANLNMTELQFAYHSISQAGQYAIKNISAYDVCMYIEVGYGTQSDFESSISDSPDATFASGYHDINTNHTITLSACDAQGRTIPRASMAVMRFFSEEELRAAHEKCLNVTSEQIIHEVLGEDTYQQVYDVVGGFGIPAPQDAQQYDVMFVTKLPGYCDYSESSCLTGKQSAKWARDEWFHVLFKHISRKYLGK